MDLALDISHYQYKIQWNKITEPVLVGGETKNVSAIIIKTSEGNTNKDGLAHAHANNAKLQGLKIGYYHFCRCGGTNLKSDAEQEADNFHSQLLTLPQADYPVVLDLEVNQILHPDEFLFWVHNFIAHLGKEVMIYGGYSFLNDNLPHDHDLGKYPLWLAQYHAPNLPVKLPNKWKEYKIWQFTQKFMHPAIEGFVDADLLRQ